jgi:inward rectifier potassium channel
MATVSGTISENIQDRDRDLGFGSVVSQQKHLRLLNRDGSFNVTRRQSLWTSFSSYHTLLTMSWPKFLLLVTSYYVFGNVIFALLYLACGPGALQVTSGPDPGSPLLKAYFFSVHTFSTIGYGNIVPVGVAVNTIVAAESLFALLGFALATGILFARFSRPTAKILFSERALIAPYEGITAFEFRITNARNNQIIELNARLLLSRFGSGQDGSRVRKYHELRLERAKVTFFPLTWTVVHPIDEASPLHGMTSQDLAEAEAEFLILLTGIDETFSQTVHARSSYRADEIVWNARYSNMYIQDEEGHILSIDMERFNNFEPADTSIVADRSSRYAKALE